MFLYEVFTIPNSKNMITTLFIVTVEKSELAFVLILYFRLQKRIIDFMDG